MHSKVYEIIATENIDGYEFELVESSLYDESSRHGFDYVSEDTNRVEDIEWLFSWLQTKPYIKCGKDDKGYFIEISEGAKDELIKEIWAEINSLYSDYLSIESKSPGMLLHRMKMAISDEYSFRFYENGILNTFQSLVTDYKPNKFYIGNTLDYHY